MGEAALAMGSGMKGTIQCKHNQFIFASRKQFEINREYLINELLKSQKIDEEIQPDSEIIGGNQAAILYQNVPNPFNSTTIIKVNVIRECHLNLELFDIFGRKWLT